MHNFEIVQCILQIEQIDKLCTTLPLHHWNRSTTCTEYNYILYSHIRINDV